MQRHDNQKVSVDAGIFTNPVSPKSPGVKAGASLLRKPVAPGKRFDIFKRDCFTCLYCGRKPPEVILHLDHLIAVANGGTNDDENLVTSCKDCNLGKSAKTMDQTPRFRPTDADRAEKLEQLRVIAQDMADRADLLEEEFDAVGVHYVRHIWKRSEDEVWLLVREEKAIRQFLNRLSVVEVMDAINITVKAGVERENDRFYYFCAVCWKKIKQPAEAKRLSDRTAGLVQPHALTHHLADGSLESGHSIGMEPTPKGKSPTPEHSSGKCSQKQ